MRAVHETVPKLLLFLLLAIPAVSFVVLRSLALVRHGKAAQVAKSFGLSAGEVPLYFPQQLRFRPRISGALDGRRVEVSEISEVNALDMQRPVTSTAFLLKLEPTLSKRLSARRKHVGRKVLAMLGAAPANTSLGIPFWTPSWRSSRSRRAIGSASSGPVFRTPSSASCSQVATSRSRTVNCG